MILEILYFVNKQKYVNSQILKKNVLDSKIY